MVRAGETKDPSRLDPPIQSPPLSAEFAAPYAARQAAIKQAEAENRPFARDRELCIPDGFPRMMTTDSPLEILQTPGRITLITEFMSQVRRVDLDRKTHPADPDDTFFGESIGRWEGDTLVVDTLALKPRVLLFNDVPHSDAIHIVEHIRLAQPDLLEDRITITDPKVLTAPWTVIRRFGRRTDERVGESVCEENNPYYRDADGRLAMRVSPQ